MEFIASLEFTDLINQLKKKLSFNFFFTLFLFIIGSALEYSLGKTFDFSFYVTELMLFCIFTCMLYFQIIPKGKVINNTAVTVTMLKDELIVTTAPIKVLFWMNKKSKQVRLHMNEVVIRNTNYSVKQIYDLDSGVFKIVAKDTELFVIVGFFDPELNRKLSELR